jgi:DNA topoisomerase-1
MKNLVVVESPSKTKKIASFLGADYEVVSSVGHIRDLPKSTTGVDVENKYEPAYLISPDKTDVVRDLKKKAKTADAIYLATDEDREGEAIAWHVGFIVNNENYLKEDGTAKDHLLAHKIKNKDGKNPKVYRVTFNSITKDAVLKAFEAPRKLNQHLIDAQQARRILDRLVGYKLSPVLWEKIRYGLSAGRVQSVAVRFIVEREREIKNFADKDYYEVEADFEKNLIGAKLSKINDKNIYKKDHFKLFAGDYSTSSTLIDSEKEAEDIKSGLSGQTFLITDVIRKETKSHPSPPFATSSMQQSASSNLGYTPQRTMQLAQKLYEAGYITYMRTDSVHIEAGAVEEIRKFVHSKFGKEYLSDSTRAFKPKKEVKTQEAHEAIRPVDIKLLPDSLPKSTNPQQKKLYELIWGRTLATQMTPAVYENVTVTIENEEKVNEKTYTFEVKGSIKRFDGFTKALGKSKKDVLLPEVKKGDKLKEKEIRVMPNKLSPPSRYSESSLVKDLESFGIGRPSTYASIVSTIQSRGYVAKEERSLYPTDNGFVVNDLLVKHFSDIVDVHFTSNMEENLDNVAAGEKDWVKLMDEFYPQFQKHVDAKRKEIKKEDVVVLEKTDRVCPECGKGHLEVKLGKYGRFYSCDQFPECKYMEGVEQPDENTEEIKEELEKQEPCEKCGGKMALKTGRFGKFFACSNYPKCKNIRSFNNKIGVKCPKCGESHQGEVVTKKTKRGKLFYGCSRYPDCDYSSWKKPGEGEQLEETTGAIVEKTKAKAKKASPKRKRKVNK